ncbi:hypothetical protein GTQ99_24035, partial [Kineococcus sp. T13]|uniref:hypothetical protein n=1 Tax=Kineococcus vitellinus TaxID=2696565 RepID=UPI001411B683
QVGVREARGTGATLWRLHANLSSTLLARYQADGAPEDLQAAVHAARAALAAVPPEQAPLLAQAALSSALRVRHRRLGGRTDLQESVALSQA